MWLVFCSSSDISALWTYHGLRQMGLSPIELVAAESLAYSPKWEHRVGKSGVNLACTLPDGRTFSSAQISGALNRLIAPSQDLILRAIPADRDYAQGELLAFYLSWLQSLPGQVINRPKPLGLCGPWFHASEWCYRAGSAGLRTARYRQSAHDSVDRGYSSVAPPSAEIRSIITLRGRVFGPQLPDETNRACVRLAEQADIDLLGLDLYCDDTGQWTFASATPTPDLLQGGDPLLEHLAQSLRGGTLR